MAVARVRGVSRGQTHGNASGLAQVVEGFEDMDKGVTQIVVIVRSRQVWVQVRVGVVERPTPKKCPPQTEPPSGPVVGARGVRQGVASGQSAISCSASKVWAGANRPTSGKGFHGTIF